MQRKPDHVGRQHQDAASPSGTSLSAVADSVDQLPGWTIHLARGPDSHSPNPSANHCLNRSLDYSKTADPKSRVSSDRLREAMALPVTAPRSRQLRIPCFDVETTRYLESDGVLPASVVSSRELHYARQPQISDHSRPGRLDFRKRRFARLTMLIWSAMATGWSARRIQNDDTPSPTAFPSCFPKNLTRQHGGRSSP